MVIKENLFLLHQSDMPLVTIITVSLNAMTVIEKTILSVINQDYDNIEYIVIDGGSTDGTTEIIKRYERKITYWQSEPDKGISDAFNKGLQHAGGDWINFLNAGDFFVDNGVVAKYMHCAAGNDILTAFVRHGKVTIPNQIMKNEESLPVKSMIAHQGSFIRKKIFEVEGGFSEEFKLRMDYDFWLRVLGRYQFYFIDEILVNYDAGLSSSDIKRFYFEEIFANSKNIKKPLLYNTKAMLKFLVKTIVLHKAK